MTALASAHCCAVSATPHLEHCQECLHFVCWIIQLRKNQNVIIVDAQVQNLHHQEMLLNALPELPSVQLPGSTAAGCCVDVVGRPQSPCSMCAGVDQDFRPLRLSSLFPPIYCDKLMQI